MNIFKRDGETFYISLSSLHISTLIFIASASYRKAPQKFPERFLFQETVEAFVIDTVILKVYFQKEVSGTIAGLSGEAHFHSSEGVEVFNRHRQHWLFNLYVLDAMREN